MKSFELEIIRPNESKKVDVVWVDVEGDGGGFVICPDHCPLFSILKPKSRLTYKTLHNLEVEIDVFGGLIKVKDNHAIVLLDN